MSDPYRISARFYDRLFESMVQGLRILGLRLYLPRTGTRILDVGCGTGAHLEMYRRYDVQLAGIDSSPAMLELARKRLGDAAVLRLADAAALPYSDQSFELVLSMLSLHEMDPQTRARGVSEIQRVMKEDGRMLLIDYHPCPTRSLQGLWTRGIILASELAAGWRHFSHFRQFMRTGGLPPLLEQAGLEVKKKRVVADGPLALFLVARDNRR